MQSATMLGLHGRIGPTLDGSPSTETHDKASTSRPHGGEDVLSRMLPKLSHMDLTGHVSDKDTVMEAHGGYCDVFVGNIASEHLRHRCTIPTGVGEVKVAIKRLRVRLGRDERFAKSLAREMAIWSRLNHPNILPLLGYLLEKDYPSLISEWIENGTVRDFVKNNPECDLKCLALGIAEGMKYIHDQDVVHSDLKADNVLISQSGEPLICDFGISRVLNSSQTFFVSTSHDGSIKGSIRWMTKELLMPEAGAAPKHTKETDVWAYGMTLYEMISKQLPYAHLRSDARVIFAIAKGELPARPHAVDEDEDEDDAYDALWSVCKRCWKDQPEARVIIAQIRFPTRAEDPLDLEMTEMALEGYVHKTPAPHKPYPESGPSTVLVASSPSLPPPPVAGPAPYAPPVPPPISTDAFLDDIDPEILPADLKKEGTDWFAIFNPKVKRVLDVNLMNTLVHESVVCCVRFSADGKYLATGCNRTAQIYDTKTGQKICILNDETASPVGDLYIRSVCFSPDGKLLATGAEDKTIRIWDIANKRVKRIFEGHRQEVYSLDFSKNGRLIVSGSGDRTTRIWDMETGMQKVFEINESYGVDAGVTSVAISPDARFVAVGSLDTVIRIWDVQTGNLLERLKGHRDSVYSVAFTPDGRGIVSGSLDKTLKHWDISTIVSGLPRKVALPPPTMPTWSGPAAATGNGSAVVRAKEGGERGSVNTLNFTGHKDYVLSVAVSHDGKWVVSGSKDRGVQFWEQRTAEVQLMLQGHNNSVISVDLSPTGGILATGSGDMQARLWSYTTI